MGRKNHFLRPAVLLNNQGMTLSEIVVVIAVVGLLALMAIMSLKPSVQIAKANDSRRKADLKKIATALEDYLGDHPCYPSAEQMSCNPGTGLRPYLDKIPCDPETGSDYPYEWGPEDNCSMFAVYSTLKLETENFYGEDKGNYVVTSPNYRIASLATPIPTSPESTPIPTSPGEPTATTAVVPTATSAPVPTSTSYLPWPTLTPGPSPTPGGNRYYSCYSHQCFETPGPICDPNYPYSDCLGLCVSSDDCVYH